MIRDAEIEISAIPEIKEAEDEILEFGGFRFDVKEHRLLNSDGDRVQISEKAFATLAMLVCKAGSLVTKEELLNEVWPDLFIEENNLHKSVHAIRRALGEKPGEQIFIETVKKHGFRFVAEVRRINLNQAKNGNGRNGAAPRIPSTVYEFPRVADKADLHEFGEVIPFTALPNHLLNLPAVSVELKEAESQIGARIKREPRRLAILALAAIAIGTVALGYYFYSNRTITGANPKKSIAVLPSRPINSANRDELYEMGIADSLIARFSSTKTVNVRPLDAMRGYTGLDQDPLAVGREQKVDYVLASNYQLADGRIKFTAQLINVASGETEETHQTEKDATDLFAMQQAISNDVGNVMLARFKVASTITGTKLGTNNREAYLQYLYGKNLTNQRSEEDAIRAIGYYERAIELDPNFARAYAGMARAYLILGYLGGLSPEAGKEKAKNAVEKAFELDGNLADAYVARADLKLKSSRGITEVEKDLLRALEIEPGNDAAHWFYSLMLAYRGRLDEAMEEIDTTLAISPGTLMYLRDRGRYLYYARRYDEAIAQLERVIELDEGFRSAWGWLWVAYELKGDYAAAYRTFINWQKLSDPDQVEIYLKAYETEGWQAVRRKFVEVEKLDEHKPNANFMSIARQYALLGEKEEAFEYLNKMVEKRHWRMVMLNIDPCYDSLRDDPRYGQILKRAGF